MCTAIFTTTKEEFTITLQDIWWEATRWLFLVGDQKTALIFGYVKINGAHHLVKRVSLELHSDKWELTVAFMHVSLF